jgi:hypothetical protein
LWLYLTALVILVGGAMNAILEEFSQGLYDKKARDAAGANEMLTGSHEERAAEKETAAAAVPHPASDGQTDLKEKPAPVAAASAAAVEAPPEKTTFKVIAGGIIASILGIISFKNKR